MKRWPESRERKSILLFSSGINYFRGGSGIADPDLDRPLSAPERKHQYLDNLCPRCRAWWTRFVPRFQCPINLTRLSEETGAKSYYLGFGEPVNLKPYFDEIEMHLNNQYLLTFDSGNGSGKSKGRFDRFHVATELPNTKFLTPSAVFLPRAEAEGSI